MKTVVYSRDQQALHLLRGVLGEHGEVVTGEGRVPDEADLILVDLSFPKGLDLIAALCARRAGHPAHPLVGAMSSSPFALMALREHGSILETLDALVARPLQAEAAQSLVVGTLARLRQRQRS